MNRDWINNAKKFSTAYLEGAKEFMQFVRDHGNGDSILCPCTKCLNLIRHTQSEVHSHINRDGMSTTYTRWTCHGEDRADDDDHGAYESDNDDGNENDNGTNDDDISDLLEDLQKTGDRGHAEPNLYSNLLEEARRELHKGCTTMTRLSFIIKMLHIKSYNRVTNRCFNQFLDFLASTFPDVDIPKSYKEAKSALSEVGLGYQTIHVCKFDCALFWEEHKDKTHCPECGLSRWRDNKGNKKIPHKVLRYFPIIPRLQRFFESKKTSRFTKWHKEQRVPEKNVLRHPADGEAWKHFDKEFGWFADDPRNIRLGMATDGFNPFGNMTNSYSMWPVFVIPYNFPPWMCMDQNNFMMSLLIPGKNSPGKDFHVFMQPLIKDMMKLWSGVTTVDVCAADPFELHAAFLWSIHDYPGYATMSGRSTRGYYACVHCDVNPCYESLKNKIGYVGHRRFLAMDHPYRKSRLFNGKVETREAPRKYTQAELAEKLARVEDYKPGKNPSNKRKRVPEKGEPTWHLKASLHALPYWPKLKIAHNLDVMNIEKNIGENILGTLLETEGKNKDTFSSRLDLQKFNIRKDYWLQDNKVTVTKPPAPWTLRKENKIRLCRYLYNCRFPDGFAANLANCVDIATGKITGLKTHDFHMLLQRVLPAGLRGIVPKPMYEAITEL